MVEYSVDGVGFRLQEPFDLDFLRAYGRLFAAFDDQDSGNLCFGVEDGAGVRRFLKVAGARTVRGSVAPEVAIERLLETIPVYEALAHPVLLGITAHHAIPGGHLAVFEWFDGICMGRMYGQTATFLALPPAEKLAIYDAILDFNAEVNRRGYVAVDFYDGCVLYDTQTRKTRICDIEMYRPGPFVNEMGRMWGSTRFMSPEEFALGAVIDARTNVFCMGAMAFELFGGGTARERAAWPLGEAAYRVALRAVQADPALRYPTIDALAEDWRRALAGEPKQK